MTKVSIGRSDGGVSIMSFPEGAELTDDFIAKEVAAWEANEVLRAADAGLPPQWTATAWARVSDDVVLDRDYRNAYEHSASGPVPNMGKARDIHRDRLRVSRAPELSSLDVAYQRADEASDTNAKAAVAKKKQALRDVTKHPAIAAAETLDDLRSLTIDKLA